jgi:glycosyltransferase involved in cell wall biosynthesis
MTLSIILPAKNEAASLEALGPKLRASYPDAEIPVVNDGSTDATVRTAPAAGISTTSHPYSKSNGAAIKTGALLFIASILTFFIGIVSEQIASLDYLGVDSDVRRTVRDGQAPPERRDS